MWIKQIYCSSALGSQVSSGGQGRKKEREKRGERGGLTPLSGDFQKRRGEAQGVIGGTPAQQMQRRRREAALLWRRGVPEDVETLQAGVGEESTAARGRQRLHTRLYPVEISRALKSSESMLPVCFCSRTQGQQRRPGPE